MDQRSLLVGPLFCPSFLQIEFSVFSCFFSYNELTLDYFKLWIPLQSCQIMIQTLKQMYTCLHITHCAHTPKLACLLISSGGAVFVHLWELGSWGVTWQWRRIYYGRGGACCCTVLSPIQGTEFFPLGYFLSILRHFHWKKKKSIVDLNNFKPVFLKFHYQLQPEAKHMDYVSFRYAT